MACFLFSVSKFSRPLSRPKTIHNFFCFLNNKQLILWHKNTFTSVHKNCWLHSIFGWAKSWCFMIMRKHPHYLHPNTQYAEVIFLSKGCSVHEVLSSLGPCVWEPWLEESESTDAAMFALINSAIVSSDPRATPPCLSQLKYLCLESTDSYSELQKFLFALVVVYSPCVYFLFICSFVVSWLTVRFFLHISFYLIYISKHE